MAINNRTKPVPKTLDEIPNKIYYSISEASEYTGVEPHVLRYWETKFSKLNPKRVGGNQRKYTRNDIELLFEIVHLLYQEGYTLDGAERKLRMGLQALRAEREAENQKKQPHPVQQTATQAAEIEVNTLPIEEPTVSDNQRKTLIQEIRRELQDILRML